MASPGKAAFLRISGLPERSRPAQRPVGGIGELLRAWQERRRYRADLRRLAGTGAHLIRDIGILPVHAAREAQKPFWQA